MEEHATLVSLHEDDEYVENEICVVDTCYKKDGLMCQPLQGETLVEDLIFSGSLKEDRENLMEAMNNFVDTNALVSRCCWKYSGGELEGEAFLEEFIALKEGMIKMKESYMSLLSDRDHILTVAEMYHCTFKKEA